MTKPWRPPLRTPSLYHWPREGCSGGIYVCQCQMPSPAEHDKFLREWVLLEDVEYLVSREAGEVRACGEDL